MKCAYCNAEITSNEQYYEVQPLVGVYLHTDCLVGKVMYHSDSSCKEIVLKLKLM